MDRFLLIYRGPPHGAAESWQHDPQRWADWFATLGSRVLDQGALSHATAFESKWAHVLSSSIGGQQTAPVVTRMDQHWDNVYLLCSDGLTKHVPDARIAERLGAMTSSRQVCEALLQDALDAGGSDNVTVIVVRDVKKDQ